MWHQVAQRCKCQKQFGEAQGLLGDEKKLDECRADREGGGGR